MVIHKEPTENDPIVICCSLAENVPRPEPGCATHACIRCRRNVLLSPNGQDFLEEHGWAKTICMECWGEEYRDED